MKRNSYSHRLRQHAILATSLVPRHRQTLRHFGYDELLRAVQLRLSFDNKTVVDAVPLASHREIVRAYNQARQHPSFDEAAFMQRYFRLDTPVADSHAVADLSMGERISSLWGELGRDVYHSQGSLIALPYPYTVPGGRFNEQFYWDSYFIMLGLMADGRREHVEAMIKNDCHMLRTYGYIPTANRSYLLTRSQPPYFSRMVRLLAADQPATLAKYLPYLLIEYRFWMKGAWRLRTSKQIAYKRVIRLPSGAILNRYYDASDEPRPEMYPEDMHITTRAPERAAESVFRDIRAAAESGWDFSSRWFRLGQHIESIHTTDFIPVDLNCLLYELEQTIADGYRRLKQSMLAKQYDKRAEQRAAAIIEYCWDKSRQWFVDYDFIQKKQSPVLTAAGVYPLSSGIADQQQALRARGTLQSMFVAPGGIVTTPNISGEQWDAPNGWAPLQWETIRGLQRYGFDDQARDIAERFIGCARHTYDTQHKLVEKYNVVDVGKAASGGEYVLQDGFGWTNGVLQALMKKYQG